MTVTVTVKGRTNLEEISAKELLVATVRHGNNAGNVKGIAHLVGVTVAVVLVAEGPVNGIKECQEDVAIGADLEQGNLLGVDDGVGHVEIKVRLAASILRSVWSSGTIDQIQVGASGIPQNDAELSLNSRRRRATDKLCIENHSVEAPRRAQVQGPIVNSVVS